MDKKFFDNFAEKTKQEYNKKRIDFYYNNDIDFDKLFASVTDWDDVSYDGPGRIKDMVRSIFDALDLEGKIAFIENVSGQDCDYFNDGSYQEASIERAAPRGEDFYAEWSN